MKKRVNGWSRNFIIPSAEIALAEKITFKACFKGSNIYQLSKHLYIHEKKQDYIT